MVQVEGDQRSALHPQTAPESFPASVCWIAQGNNYHPATQMFVELLDVYGSNMFALLLLSSLSLL